MLLHRFHAPNRIQFNNNTFDISLYVMDITEIIFRMTQSEREKEREKQL